VPGRFKDYISTPKPNNYRSIHTGVIGPERQRIEVQIRTREMQDVAELGVAAHWRWKQEAPQLDGRQYRWLRELLDILEHARVAIADLYREYPVLLSDAATGPAPLGLESTGDPCKNAPWTGLHGPAIAIPVPGNGLRVGLQLTAAIGNDDVLLETARLVEAALHETE